MNKRATSSCRERIFSPFRRSTRRISECLSRARHRRLRIITSLLLPEEAWEPYCSRARSSNPPSPPSTRLSLSVRRDLPFSRLYPRVHAYSSSFLSPLPLSSFIAVFHVSTGWRIRGARAGVFYVIRWKSLACRKPLERILRRRMSQGRGCCWICIRERYTGHAERAVKLRRRRDGPSVSE